MEFPLLNKLSLEGEMPVVSISIDVEKDVVLRYMKENDLQMPVVIDSDRELSAILGVRALPTNVILDKEGKAVARIVGVISEDDAEKIMKEFK